MFGDNPIRSATRDPNNLAVEEIFYTIQGEGPLSGMPALFIRMAGCNLACHFCDTQFERFADVKVSLSEVYERISAFPAPQRRTVVLTGGEPLNQDVTKLIAWLLAGGTWTVQIETAGTVWPGVAMTALMERYAGQRIVIVCSPKTPKIHPEVVRWCTDWKYIIRAGETDPVDGLPNYGTQRATQDKLVKLYRGQLEGTIWLSPCDDYNVSLNQANLAAVTGIAMEHGYRISLQTHKLLGVA